MIKIGEITLNFNLDNVDELYNIIDVNIVNKIKNSITLVLKDIERVFSSLEFKPEVTAPRNILIEKELIEIFNYLNENIIHTNDILLDFLHDYSYLCYNWNKNCNNSEIRVQIKIDKTATVYGFEQPSLYKK